ncbi:MAG TPA: hypothetical protein VI653_05165 [Steroidobacteraceae bacterium]
MTTTEVLTEREQQALEHMRKAQELGVTLKEYAARVGLDVQMLYQLRKPLVRKGALGPVRRASKEAPTAEKVSAFLPVRVVSAGPRPGSVAVACRLVHPSGWVLECDGLPPASWVTAVLAGGAHATA